MGLGSQGDDREFGAAVEDFLIGHLRVEKLDVQGHLWVAPGIGPQQGRQAMQADVMAGGQGQAPADFAGEVGQGPARVVQHVDDLIGPGQQGPASLCKTDFTAQAIEQSHIELLFQCGDALADGRLGQVQALARAREAAGFGDGDEGIEVGLVHLAFLLVIQIMKNMNLSYLI